MITVEKKLQIRSSTILGYTKFTGTHLRTDKQKQSAANLARFIKKTPENSGETETTYSGKLKDGAKKRLSKAIENLVSSTKRTFIYSPVLEKMVPFQLGFLTLTIHSPDRNIQQKEAHKMLLGPFLQWLRRSHNVYLYIWKAELQKRGQLHYHLLLGKFVCYDEIRAKWNELQRDAGYLDMYFKEHGHYNAPSTEIKNALENKDVAGYLKKEVAKNLQNIESVGGKVWDCSMNLKETAAFEVDAVKYEHILNQWARGTEVHALRKDHFSMYFLNLIEPIELLDRGDKLRYNEHYRILRERDMETHRKEQKVSKAKQLAALMSRTDRFFTRDERIIIDKAIAKMPSRVVTVPPKLKQDKPVIKVVNIPIQINLFSSS